GRGGRDGPAARQLAEDLQFPNINHEGNLTQSRKNKQMDVGYFWVQSWCMTAILILTVLLLLAIAGPMFGADTRSSKGWSASDADGPLWSGSGVRATR
ncbi:MAG: hypothetical protein ABWZ98_13755, partial [Nakamurella sp.]